jgi:hypothetical protein
MWHFQSKECADPRDKAYLLLYLSNDAANIKVDYRTLTAQLALDLLREWAVPFCLCLMKLLLQSLWVDGDRLSQINLLKYDKSYLEFKAYDIGNANVCGHCEESLNLKSIEDKLRTEQVWLCCLSCRHQFGWWSRHGHFLLTVSPASMPCVYFLQGGHYTQGWAELPENLREMGIFPGDKFQEKKQYGGHVEAMVFYMPVSIVWELIHYTQPDVCVYSYYRNWTQRQVLRRDKPYVPWQPFDWSYHPQPRGYDSIM